MSTSHDSRAKLTPMAPYRLALFSTTVRDPQRRQGGDALLTQAGRDRPWEQTAPRDAAAEQQVLQAQPEGARRRGAEHELELGPGGHGPEETREQAEQQDLGEQQGERRDATEVPRRPRGGSCQAAS